MAERVQCTHDPVSIAGEVLDPYRHICAFVDSRAEMQRLFDPFLLEGLEVGDRLSFVVGPQDRAVWVRHFRQAGFDMPALLEQRRFEVRTWLEERPGNARFDKDAMLELLEEALGSPPEPRVRLVSEMGWAAADDNRDLLEFEARANYLMPDHPHIAVCVYDTAQFGGDVMIDILRTHPMALIGGVLQINPFYVPPDEFLAELRSRETPGSNA
ncbi:MAG TPA: MEDS domain-containing protein [Thermomicrobiales bacterium]|nr:MEDS domain-containing protein [Thermomicrobiales bacterium]